jgi:gentisate 1,2-dioxygenase
MIERFVDVSGLPVPEIKAWDPIVIRKAAIDREIERLADAPCPENGIRAAKIVHPQSVPPGLGMTPGIDITVHVLKPGERTRAVRHNSSQVSLCIRGRGQARIGARSFGFERRDVWNTPGMHPYSYINDGDDLMVRLTYSNGALLEKLLIHYVEEMSDSGFAISRAADEKVARVRRASEVSPPISLGKDGAQLLTYEHLIAPDAINNQALIWPWKAVEVERDKMFAPDRTERRGRSGLFVLYNPATGRTAGCTHNFFATLGFMQPQVIDFLHRHSSNAINYAIEGSFVSEVEGQRIEWFEGDIAYTAPGWAFHANGADANGGGIALTVQDHPFQIATDCLIWQEREDQPILLLGSQQGFDFDDSVRDIAAE